MWCCKIYISLWTNYNSALASLCSCILLIYISLWTNYNNIARLCDRTVDKFTFHYELIITVVTDPPYNVNYRFTFHYELIITKLYSVPTGYIHIYISLWTNYNLPSCHCIALTVFIYISLWTNYNSVLLWVYQLRIKYLHFTMN